MITIGTDSHKKTHTFVAVDDVGRCDGEKTLAATNDGHLASVQWAAQRPQVTFALEDCRHLTRRLERDLLTAGHRVLRVPTKLMAGARRGGREPGKSDPIDVTAVALAALRHPDLPVAELDGPTREIKLLVDHRRDLVSERTRVHNRLRWHLHELDPTLHVPSRGLRRYCVLRRTRRSARRVRRAGRAARTRAGRTGPAVDPADQRPRGRVAAAGPPARPVAARGPRLRGARRGDDPG